MKSMKIKFCGASEGVTGSCHMITTDSCRFLLDCGMFQGNKENERKNRDPFPFEPEDIDFVVLSHAHIDHCGRLPLLVKRGFRGSIYCTFATADLLDVMLKDSAYIQARETEYENKKAERLGRPTIEPIYDIEDVERTLRLVSPILYGIEKDLAEGVRVKFTEAGHILGSCAVELWIKDRKLVFSGDIGVHNKPLLRDPQFIKDADIVIMETTYGNRLHPKSSESLKQLASIIKKTIKRGGTVIIPAFAVGRTQEILYYINQLFMNDKEFAEQMKDIKFFVDSPMADAATEVFKKNAHVFDDESRELIKKGENPIGFANLRFVKSTTESQTLNADRSPKVIISASGMCDNGRVKHHLKHNLWNSLNSVIFAGYQAEGTLGRLIVEGAESVRIFGELITVGAEIYDIKGFSGHADMEGLLEWLGAFNPKPENVFLVHGETQSKIDFAKRVESELGIKPVTIMENCSVDLSDTLTLKKTPKQQSELKDEAIFDMRRRLIGIHNDLENILYNTALATDDTLTEEKIRRIGDLLRNLEKDSINLGSAVTDIKNEDAEGLEYYTE